MVGKVSLLFSHSAASSWWPRVPLFFEMVSFILKNDIAPTVPELLDKMTAYEYNALPKWH